MKIALVGGGSGGHIFPLIAVQAELQSLNTDNNYIVITDGLDQSVKDQFLEQTKFYQLRSGKLRRFSHWRWWEYFYPTRYKFYLLNLVDIFRTLTAIFKAFRLISYEQPDVIFAKGGFISLPVGLVAGWKHIPLVIHDSDTRPGLTNRLLAPRAKVIATGMPVVGSSEKSKFVGVPVRNEFFNLNQSEARKQLTNDIGLNSNQPILLVTGGSLGAKRINDVVIAGLGELTKTFTVIHIAGSKDYQRLSQITGGQDGNYQLHDFVSKLYPAMVVASDIVIGRAGATTIAESAASAKPTVFIPNSYLSDQVSNAAWLQENQAGLILSEDELSAHPHQLADSLKQLIDDKVQLKTMSNSIQKLANPKAAQAVAELIIDSV